MKDWKTTLSSFAVIVAWFIQDNTDLFEDSDRSIWVRLAKFVMVGGMASFGISAKDK